MNWLASRYFRIPDSATDLLPIVGVHAWALYTVLARMADTGGECFPSRDHLATKSGLSHRATRAAEQALVDAGLVEIRPRFTPGGGCRSNLYRLIAPPPIREGASEDGGAPRAEGAHGATLAPDDSRTPHGAPGEGCAPCGDEGCAPCAHKEDTQELDPHEGNKSPASQARDQKSLFEGSAPISPQSKKRKPKGKLSPDPDLVRIACAWNESASDLGLPKVKISPIRKNIQQGWKTAEVEPELKKAFEDMPALMNALAKRSTWLREQKFVDLGWLFCKSKRDKWNAVEVLEGFYNGKRNGTTIAHRTSQGRGLRGTVGPDNQAEIASVYGSTVVEALSAAPASSRAYATAGNTS